MQKIVQVEDIGDLCGRRTGVNGYSEVVPIEVSPPQVCAAVYKKGRIAGPGGGFDFLLRAEKSRGESKRVAL